MSDSLTIPEVVAKLQHILAERPSADLWHTGISEIKIVDCEIVMVGTDDTPEVQEMRNDLHEARADIEYWERKSGKLEDIIEQLRERIKDLEAAKK